MPLNFNTYNFENKKVLLRVDFNVPLHKETKQVTDTTRITAAVPTIKKILQQGGSVVLMSHLGRPKSAADLQYSLQPVAPILAELLQKPVLFVANCTGTEAQKAVETLQNGGVVLLENLRFYAEEEKGDPQFAQQLANLGCNVYVNDAFGTAHRPHASVYTVASFFEEKMCGLLMQSELENAQNLLHNPQTPVTAILGGAKVSDKIQLIESMLHKVNNLLIGGGMAYTFLKAQGYEIGKSLLEADKVALAKELLQKAKQNNVNLLLPSDSVTAPQFDNNSPTTTYLTPQMPATAMGLDIGSQTIEAYTKVILQSKTIFWNGPMGVFEMSNFQKGTQAIAQAVAQATQQNQAYSLIGGGDSVAAIHQFNLATQVSYISTGGGAMLELLEGKTLPGVQAIVNA